MFTFSGGNTCGAKKQETSFVSTGNAKGHYPIYVCDKEPHDRGKHHDSAANKSWY